MSLSRRRDIVKFFYEKRNIFCHSKKIFLWHKESVLWISENSEICNIYNSWQSEKFIWIKETILPVNEIITLNWKIFLIRRNIISFAKKRFVQENFSWLKKKTFFIIQRRCFFYPKSKKCFFDSRKLLCKDLKIKNIIKFLKV